MKIELIYRFNISGSSAIFLTIDSNRERLKRYRSLLSWGGIMTWAVFFAAHHAFSIPYPVKKVMSLDKHSLPTCWIGVGKNSEAPFPINRSRQVLYILNRESKELSLFDLKTNRFKKKISLASLYQNESYSSEDLVQKWYNRVPEQVVTGTDYIVWKDCYNHVTSFKLNREGQFDLEDLAQSFQLTSRRGWKPWLRCFEGDLCIYIDPSSSKEWICVKLLAGDSACYKIQSDTGLPVGYLQNRYFLFANLSDTTSLKFYDTQEKKWVEKIFTFNKNSSRCIPHPKICTDGGKVYVLQGNSTTNQHRHLVCSNTLYLLDPQKGEESIMTLNGSLNIVSVFEGCFYYTRSSAPDRVSMFSLSSLNKDKQNPHFCFDFQGSEIIDWDKAERLFFSETHGFLQAEDQLLAFPLLPTKKRVMQMVQRGTYLDYFLSLKESLSVQEREKIDEIWKKDYSEEVPLFSSQVSVKPMSSDKLTPEDIGNATQLKDLPVEIQRMIWEYLESPKEILSLALAEKSYYLLLSKEPLALFLTDDLVNLANSAIKFRITKQRTVKEGELVSHKKKMLETCAQDIAEKNKSRIQNSSNDEFYACLERLLRKRSPIASEVCAFLLMSEGQDA